MIEMTVTGIVIDAANRTPIVLLKDPLGRRQVPIWINQFQAQSIVEVTKQISTSPPNSHDLMVSLIQAGDLLIDRIIIHSIQESTFLAILKLRSKKTIDKSKTNFSSDLHQITCRPSDGIALAIRTNCSIWMPEEVVASASIPVDAEADVEDQAQFRRFLEGINPSDLIRHFKNKNQIGDDSLENLDNENESTN